MDIDASFNERYAKWTITDKANSILKGAAFDALTAEETTRAEAIKKWSAKNDGRVWTVELADTHGFSHRNLQTAT